MNVLFTGGLIIGVVACGAALFCANGFQLRRAADDDVPSDWLGVEVAGEDQITSKIQAGHLALDREGKKDIARQNIEKKSRLSNLSRICGYRREIKKISLLRKEVILMFEKEYSNYENPAFSGNRALWDTEMYHDYLKQLNPCEPENCWNFIKTRVSQIPSLDQEAVLSESSYFKSWKALKNIGYVRKYSVQRSHPAIHLDIPVLDFELISAPSELSLVNFSLSKFDTTLSRSPTNLDKVVWKYVEKLYGSFDGKCERVPLSAVKNKCYSQTDLLGNPGFPYMIYSSYKVDCLDWNEKTLTSLSEDKESRNFFYRALPGSFSTLGTMESVSRSDDASKLARKKALKARRKVLKAAKKETKKG